MPLPEIAPPKHFPYCIVWTPIPLLTWIFPFIGHVGICLSSGIILDFAGPYYVAVDTLAFGNPTRYLRLDPDLASFSSEDEATSPARSVSAAWDKALQGSTSLFKLKSYSLVSQNCHSFVGHFLNQVQYDGKRWDLVAIAAALFLQGRFVDIRALAKTWLPHLALVIVGVYIWRIVFFVCWVLFTVAPAAWLAYSSQKSTSLLAAVTSPVQVDVRLV